MLGKAIWRLRIQENPSSAGAQELRPGPRWGSLQRCRKPASWWEGAGCPLPKNPIHRSRPFGPRLSYPHSKISSDDVGCFVVVVYLSQWTNHTQRRSRPWLDVDWECRCRAPQASSNVPFSAPCVVPRSWPRRPPSWTHTPPSRADCFCAHNQKWWLQLSAIYSAPEIMILSYLDVHLICINDFSSLTVCN